MKEEKKFRTCTMGTFEELGVAQHKLDEYREFFGKDYLFTMKRVGTYSMSGRLCYEYAIECEKVDG